MSVFKLPQTLESSNSGITDFKYNQYNPRTNVISAATGLLDKRVDIPFTLGPTEWWMPSRSYVKVRYTIALVGGAPFDNLTNVKHGAVSMNTCANLFSSGSFTLNNKRICSIESNLPQVDILEQRLHKSGAWLESVGASTNNLQQDPTDRELVLQKTKEFESVWQPKCLSIFKYAGALPTGNYQLSLQPDILAQSISSVQNRWQEPAMVNGVDFEFKVQSIELYVATLEGERVDDAKYLISLNQTNCVDTSFTTSAQSLTKTYFNVAPTSKALTVAFQTDDVATSKASASRFTCLDANGDQREKSLNRLFIQYAGKTFPKYEVDSGFDSNVAVKKDYTTQRYVDSQINSGSYFSEGGAEGVSDWHSRGSYHHFLCPKEVGNRATRATVNTQFADDMTGNKILLFDHSTVAVQVVIDSGIVREVQVLDL